MAHMRLDKYLSNMGYGSRTEIKTIIRKGEVKVNNTVVKDASFNINTDKDVVVFDGKVVEFAKYRYIMMNKPPGIVSSTESIDENVIDILEENLRKIDLFPAGRLDKDTEGLILLTNDGKMAHKLLSPKKHVDKRYYVEIDGILNNEAKKNLEKKAVLDDGYECLPCEIEIIEQNEHLGKLYIVIREGKYHQIKRMFESVERNVKYLKRLSIGKLILDENLKIGEYRDLNKEELEGLPVTED